MYLREMTKMPGNRWNHLIRLIVFAAAAGLVSSARVQAANDVVDGMLLFNDNAAWSWFEDERAIVDAASGKILVSSVANTSGSGGAARNGDVELATLDLDTMSVSSFQFHDALQADDHNSAALIIRPDGRYLAMWGMHAAGGENGQQSFYRVSTNPGDASSWGSMQSFDNNASMTYSNLHYLPNDNGGAGRMYNFTRTNNFNPNLLVSNDQGTTWSYGGRLLTIGTGSIRPYVRYWSDQNRIHLITTEGHPRDVDNSIYYGFVQDGQLFKSDGSTADANLFDTAAIAPNALTTVFATGTVVDGAAMRRAWTVDVAADAGGNPVAVFQARADGLDSDHRFFYSRWTGTQWQVNPLGYAGSYLYAPENDYTGLVSIDPSDVNTVYLSSEVHPATKAQLIGADGLRHYELFKGTTTDSGATWSWSPITFNSTMHNVRPLVPKWDSSNTALLWMRGTYTTYTNYNMDAVGLVNPEIPDPELALAVDFGADGQLVQSDFQPFTRAANPPGNEQTEMFNSPHAAGGGQISVTVGGGDVQFFDRGDDVVGRIGDVVDDFALVNGDMTLSLGHLAEGRYQLVLYSHDRNINQLTSNITLSGVPIGVLNSTTGANPSIGVASSRVGFSTRTGNVALTLDGPGGAGNVVLNGFELYFVDGNPVPLVDLNADANLNLSDFEIYILNMHTNLTGLSQAQAYAKGDLNGDFQNNFADLVIFRQAYDLWNGEGALAAALANVPEPATMWILLVGALIVHLTRLFPAANARDQNSVGKANRTMLGECLE